MKHGFPHAWYWKADDGRVYSAAKQSVVTESDPGYVTFIETRGGCTRWPVDLDGQQTDASLLDVVGQYGLHLSQNDALVSYAEQKFLAVRGGGVTVGGVTVQTDAHSLAELHILVAGGHSEFDKKLDGVAVFLKAARDAYSTVLAAIKAGKIKTKADIDNSVWPKNS